MCKAVRSILRAVAPIVGFAFGGPAGAAIAGGLVGAATGGGIKGAALGAIGGYFGGGALQSGGFIGGEGLGAFANSVGPALSNLGSGLGFGGGEALYAAGGADPIQLIAQLDSIGGGAGATAGAEALGYASVEQAVANAAQWAGGAALGDGQTPPASMGGMVSKLGQGVTPMDLAKQASGGMMGGRAGGMMSPWQAAQGAYGLYNSERLKKLSGEMAAQADPNAPYRAGYAARLNTLSSNPSSIYSTPGYAAGEQAVQRTMAAQGYQGSGNMAVAMQKYGGDFYNQEVARLAQLSGAAVSPAVAPVMQLEGNINAMNLAGQSITSLGYGVTQRRY